MQNLGYLELHPVRYAIWHQNMHVLCGKVIYVTLSESNMIIIGYL